MKEKDIIKDALDAYADSLDAWNDAREAYEDDIAFALGSKQWDEGVKAARERKRRPCLTINRLAPQIRHVVNDARLNRPAITASPVDSVADPETAEVLNGIIKNIEAASFAEVAYETALSSAVSGGFGFWRIDVDYANPMSMDKVIRIGRIHDALSVVPDPYTTAVDGTDWNTAFITEMIPRSQFEEEYPDADPVSFGDGHDATWCSKDEIRRAEYWQRVEESAELVQLSSGQLMLGAQYNENKMLYEAAGIYVVGSRPTKIQKVTQRIITAKEVLNTVDWAGIYIPIVPVYGDEFVHDGKRVFLSLTRYAKDPQRNFNYWRSAATELVALAPKAPFIGPRGAFKSDSRRWETANEESHAYIEYDGTIPPQRQPFSGVPAGAIQEAINAADDLKAVIGMHDPSLGAADGDMSGVAIHQERGEGDVANYHFVGNWGRAMRYTGLILMDLIPKVYSGERIERTLGSDGKSQMVPINQQYNKGGIAKLHDLNRGSYDVTIETGPAFATQRQEALDRMENMIKAAPQLMTIIGDLMAQNMDWPGADDIAKRLKVLLPPELQGLDDLSALPPEAQAVVARSQAQLKQAAQIIEQGKAMLMQKDQEIQVRDKLLIDKQNEIAQRDTDSMRDYQATLAKINADLKIAGIKNDGAERLKVLEAQLDQMAKRQEAAAERAAQITAALPEIVNSLGSLGSTVTALKDRKPKPVRLSIQAPSGKVYTGTIGDDDADV